MFGVHVQALSYNRALKARVYNATSGFVVALEIGIHGRVLIVPLRASVIAVGAVIVARFRNTKILLCFLLKNEGN